MTAGTIGRDAALVALAEKRGRVVAALRAEAWLQAKILRRPISVNDVRHVLSEMDYNDDPRILGTTFKMAGWRAVGWTMTDSKLANARPVRTFWFSQ